MRVSVSVCVCVRERDQVNLDLELRYSTNSVMFSKSNLRNVVFFILIILSLLVIKSKLGMDYTFSVSNFCYGLSRNNKWKNGLT